MVFLEMDLFLKKETGRPTSVGTSFNYFFVSRSLVSSDILSS